MVFSSPAFVFIFFPLVFLVYWGIDEKYKNMWLLFASICFYAWSGLGFLILLLFSVSINWLLGRFLALKNKKVLIFCILFNLSLLFFFKYCRFFVENILMLLFGWKDLGVFSFLSNIVMPIGISFFTFQILAYDIDVFEGKVEAEKKYTTLLLYVIMFPQLIAGPIVRYIDVRERLKKRSCRREDIYNGLRRFIYGLGKKVLLADILGAFTQSIFSLGYGSVNVWLGMIAYSLQIYYDFSGYSDMAIGMGKMFGFDFLENFNNPYQSKSIKEFWRRWHISLSGWFRDYLYIPLGGNRKGKIKTYRNLIIVFLATGLWHGAAWNFVLWGLWHGLFLIVERIGFSKVLNKLPAVVQRVYTLMIVGLGWLMFRAENLEEGVKSVISIFRYDQGNLGQIISLFDPKLVICFVAAIVLCLPQCRKTWNVLVKNIGTIFLFWVTLLQIIASNFSPFLYFRF